MEHMLDKRIRQKLLDVKQSLEGDSNHKLFTSDELKEYYATFRNRFGPDKLSGQDGKALLETMHSHGSKNSLVYWLEFKHDDEFPSTRFGSIAGGSAFKFGLFCKKETSIWTTGTPGSPRDLTVDEAIAMARRNRDQLVAGARLLEELPVHGSDPDYERLQQEMERVEPNVSDSAWGHKYFHLLYPEKLDDFHNPDYQRFHLVKLLQLPPQKKGRYIAGGRFVEIADALQMPMNTLTTILNTRDGSSPYTYWRVGTSDNKDIPANQWEMMRSGKFVGVGWDGFGSLDDITNDKAGKEAIRTRLQSTNSGMGPIAVGKAAAALFNFRWTISNGDIVLASDVATVLGIGRVTGDYFYDATRNFPHCRPVEWLSLTEWKQPDFEGKLTTLWRMQKDVNLVEAERRILDAPPKPPAPPPPPIPPQRNDVKAQHVPLPLLDGMPSTLGLRYIHNRN